LDGGSQRDNQRMGSRLLHRYWFTFTLQSEDDLPPTSRRGHTLYGGSPLRRVLGSGVGVTGFSEEDCLEMIQELLPDDSLPPVATVEIDVDVSNVNDSHWRHGMIAVPSERGIWFPPFNLSRTETWR
jgi:hypothetical protein